MTPSLLREAGEALYGLRWQSDLGRDLRVSDRTVRRWSAGAFSIPSAVAAELRGLLRARKTALADVLRRLPSQPKSSALGNHDEGDGAA